MTDRYCVFGNPIGHSKSPAIHTRFAQQTGEDIFYEARLAPIDGFAAAVRDFIVHGGRGANVTVPFKEEAFRLCDRHTPRALQAGAVNTLIFAFNIYSWPWSDLNDFVLWLTVSYCIYRHLRLISRKRRWVLGAMSALFVAALILPARYTLSEYGRENVGEMQIPSSLRPPWMRVADGVTPEEFVK